MPTLYEQILNKPKSYRRKLSFVLTGIIGIFIIAIWLVITTFSMQKAFNFGKSPGEDDDSSSSSPSKENSLPSFYEEKEGMESIGKDFESFFSEENPFEESSPENSPSEIDYSELEKNEQPAE